MLWPIVDIVLFGYPVFCIALFFLMRPRNAVLIALIGGWLFLPERAIGLPGLPDYTKMVACSIGPLAGILLFCPSTLTKWRPNWLDVPMAIWCLAPAFSAVVNGLGPYDAMSSAVAQFINWGLPYVIGRAMFSSLEGLRDLALGIFIGGLIYIPLCLYEIKMSPQLHGDIWGYRQHRWSGERLGGWRPSVFMQNGLALGLWMSAATLSGLWLWQTQTVRRVFGLPIMWCALSLLGVTVLCRSAGALMALLLGIALLMVVRYGKTTLPIIIMAMVPPVYALTRTTNLWDGQFAVETARVLFDRHRAASLEFRFENERTLADHAMKRPVFGWGRHNRSRPVSLQSGDRRAIVDGLWVLALGQTGLVGLVSMFTVLIGPVIILAMKMRPRAWLSPAGSSIAILATILLMFVFDGLMNAMLNAVFFTGLGAVVGANISQINREAFKPRVSQPTRRVQTKLTNGPEVKPTSA